MEEQHRDLGLAYECVARVATTPPVVDTPGACFALRAMAKLGFGTREQIRAILAASDAGLVARKGRGGGGLMGADVAGAVWAAATLRYDGEFGWENILEVVKETAGRGGGSLVEAVEGVGRLGLGGWQGLMEELLKRIDEEIGR